MHALDCVELVDVVKEQAGQHRVILRAPAFLEQILDPLGSPGLFVAALVAEGIEYVGNRRDAGKKTDLLAAQAGRVTFSVPAFVVVAGNQGSGLQDLAMRVGENGMAFRGMRLHFSELFRCQLAGFEEYVVRDADFADIVHRRSIGQQFDILMR